MRTIGVNERGLRVGQDHQRAVLLDADVDAMRALNAQGMTYTQLADIFEVSKGHARRVCLGEQRAQRATDWRRIVTGSVPLDEPAMVTP